MAPRHVTEFVRQLTPMAVEIGDRYGIDPALIITQAAIESGWGEKVSGNNYFGVKSHGQPGGQTITTHEEINGQRVKVQDDFRVYDSLAGSMEDYAKFLSSNPRYGDVFKTRDLNKQVEAIANSGYATDSKYPGLLRDVSRMVTREMGPMPPSQVPNTVATQTDTQRPPTMAYAPSGSSPQQITGKSNAPTSAASRQVPTNWFTPRLAPGNEQAYTYQIPDQTPTSVVGGLGSLTPDRAPPPLPRPRPGMPVVPYDRGQTVATVPTPQRQSLPPLPPSNLAPANLVSTTMERANAARVPELQAALARPQTYVERNAPPNLFGMNGDPGTAAQGTRVASIPTSGVGKPPASRSVPSVPVRTAQAGPMNDIGAMPSFAGFSSAFAPPPPPVPTTAVPGPNAMPKGSERLVAGIYPSTAGHGLPPAVPDVGVASAMSVIPPMPRPRPVPFSMPTPMGQRPTLPMPRANPFAMPTPAAQRPNPNALRVTVNGAGSYNAPQRAPTPTREQQIAAILARSRGPAAFGGGGTIDGAVQPIGTLSGRR